MGNQKRLRNIHVQTARVQCFRQPHRIDFNTFRLYQSVWTFVCALQFCINSCSGHVEDHYDDCAFHQNTLGNLTICLHVLRCCGPHISTELRYQSSSRLSNLTKPCISMWNANGHENEICMKTKVNKDTNEMKRSYSHNDARKLTAAGNVFEKVFFWKMRASSPQLGL